MGTSLTGTKPKDTYDSLIKVGDNGPISGTAKVLSDGLGNDLPIAVSTSRVGIGTSSPAGNLHIASASDTGIRIQAGTSSLSYIDLADSASGAPAGSIAYNHIVDAIVFGVGGSNTERFRMTANGLCFNGDTAAANALDDYEEGTWTPNILFGGASVGVTYGGSNGGTYTKVGRKVSVNGYLDVTNKGTSTGNAQISNLPFTIGGGASNYGAVSFRPVNISFADMFIGYGDVNDTKISLQECTNAGVVSSLSDADFATSVNIIFSFTYFV